MIMIAIITVCLCTAIAWGIWHDSKKFRAENSRLDAGIKRLNDEIELTRRRIEATEKGVQAIGSRLAAISTSPPIAPMQRFDPQASKRAQEQARHHGKHKR